MVHDAHVEDRRARVGEAGCRVADPGGLGTGVEGVLVLEHKLERWRIACLRACGPRVRVASAGDHVGQVGACEAEGRPTVGELDRPAERPCRAATDPDRDVRLHGARIDDEAVVRVVLTPVRGLELGQ